MLATTNQRPKTAQPYSLIQQRRRNPGKYKPLSQKITLNKKSFHKNHMKVYNSNEDLL